MNLIKRIFGKKKEAAETVVEESYQYPFEVDTEFSERTVSFDNGIETIRYKSFAYEYVFTRQEVLDVDDAKHLLETFKDSEGSHWDREYDENNRLVMFRFNNGKKWIVNLWDYSDTNGTLRTYSDGSQMRFYEHNDPELYLMYRDNFAHSFLEFPMPEI